MVERLADPDVPLGEAAGRGLEDHLMHDRRVAIVQWPASPARVGRGGHQDNLAARSQSLDDRGIAAVKGRWLSEHTFRIERRILGHAETQSWELTFVGKSVDISFESTDGAKAELHGEEN